MPPKGKNQATPTKEKMIPADRIYHRLIWDDRIPVSDFDLGYEDRFKGILFLPLTRFRHTGDETTEIPFHRVRLFRYKGDVIWDRENRIDIIDSIFDENGEENGSSVLQGSIVGSNTVKIVKPRSEEELDLPESFRVCSFNVLFDKFNTDKIYTPWRIPLVANELESQDADIIGLQEVTAEIYQILRGSSELLREKYYWTTPPDDVPSSQIILSKYPILECVSLAVSKSKRVIFALLDVNSTTVIVCNCHLVSDFGNNPCGRRIEDLKLIMGHMAPFSFSILLGDFNFGDQGVEQQQVPWRPYVDSYLFSKRKGTVVMPTAPLLKDAVSTPGNPEEVAKKEGRSLEGFTYDVTKNPLAAVSSEHNVYPRRLDRILVNGMDVEEFHFFGDKTYKIEVPSHIPPFKRGSKKNVEQAAIDYEDDSLYTAPPIRGASKTINIFPSDHFGIATKVKLNFEAAMNDTTQETFFPCFQCALCIIPPAELHGPINEFRERFDQGYPRWMPHINILHPFVQFDRLADAIPLVEKALSAYDPFVIELKQVDSFDARRNIVFITPEARDDFLSKIHDAIQLLFPGCVKEREQAYNPHLTLGQVDKNRFNGFAKQFYEKWQPTEFTVDEISVVGLLEGEENYQVLHTFKLGAHLDDLEEPKKNSINNMVLEFPKWGNKLLQKYSPADQLERWMLQVSQSNYARDAPTHISQKGAMYHIPSDLINEYLHYWKRSVELSEEIHFFMEEIRGSPFRLYLDLDVKSTVKAPLNLEDVITKILTFTLLSFPGCESSECLVLDCHGDWADQKHTDAVFKSGYRLYFQKIFVDEPTYAEYLGKLIDFLKSDEEACALLMSPDTTPKGMTWDEICDVKSAAWDRGRLMGTIKRRHTIVRRYNLNGIFTAYGKDEEQSNIFAEDLRRVLYGSTLRVWDSLPNAKILVDNNFLPERLFTSINQV